MLAMGYSTMVLAVANIIMVLSAGHRENKYRDGDKTMDVNDDTSLIRRTMENQLPRQVIIDMLSKGRYFRDIFSEHLEPLEIQFGHVCENPNEWEQRFERKDLKRNKHQGKVRWGNKNEEYGEHYWDLNHGQNTRDP